MGRTAEPAQSKILKGNFRVDRHSHGPQVEIKAPPCPAWLPRGAKKYWSDIAPELQKVGLIGVVDTAAFAAHCDSVAKFEEVTKKLKKLEDLTDSTPQGYMVQSALFTIRNKLWEQVMKSANEFGLSPAGRSKVKATNPEQPTLDGWDAF